MACSERIKEGRRLVSRRLEKVAMAGRSDGQGGINADFIQMKGERREASLAD